MEQLYNKYFFVEPNQWKSSIRALSHFLINPKGNRPLIIFIGGPTGVGKSSVSLKLCDLLGIRNFISTDTIKCILEVNNRNSILSYFSHDCWKYLGDFTKENLYSAFSLQSKTVCDSIDILLHDSVRHKKNTLFEGIHLLPSIIEKKQQNFPELNIVNISIITDYNFFIETLLPNRIASTYRHRKEEDYKERLIIYKCFIEFWRNEINSNNSHFIENKENPAQLVKALLDKLLLILNHKDSK